jgi:hypothetical protein
VGDQREQDDSADHIPQKYGYHEVSDHHADAELSNRNQQESLHFSRDNMGEAADCDPLCHQRTARREVHNYLS